MRFPTCPLDGDALCAIAWVAKTIHACGCDDWDARFGRLKHDHRRKRDLAPGPAAAPAFC